MLRVGCGTIGVDAAPSTIPNRMLRFCGNVLDGLRWHSPAADRDFTLMIRLRAGQS